MQLTRCDEMHNLKLQWRVKSLPKDMVQSLLRIRRRQTLCGPHGSVDLSELLAFARRYSKLQSQNYLDYRSALLALLNSVLLEMSFNGADIRSSTWLNIQSCIKMLQHHRNYHRFHSSMKMFQENVQIWKPLHSLENRLHLDNSIWFNQGT